MIRPGRNRLTFSRTHRLNRASEFGLVKESGKSWTGRHLVMAVLKNEVNVPARIGIITTRRLGGAATRNLIRRRIREIFRLHQYAIRRGVWIVTIARFTASRASYAELERDWLRLAERASIVSPRCHGAGS
jgi:ribonuclease P protein component